MMSKTFYSYLYAFSTFNALIDAGLTVKATLGPGWTTDSFQPIDEGTEIKMWAVAGRPRVMVDRKLVTARTVNVDFNTPYSITLTITSW